MRPVDCIVHNAGVMAVPFKESPDGFETTLQVNYLSPFLLTALLLPNLRAASKARGAAARVVTVSSGTHRSGDVERDVLRIGAEDIGNAGAPSGSGRRPHSKWRAYATSKLCGVLFTSELQRRVPPEEVIAVAVRPGTVRTGISRNSPGLALLFGLLDAVGLMTDPEAAARSVAAAVLREDGQLRPGAYYDRFEVGKASREARNVSLQKLLWDWTADRLRHGRWLPIEG
ncbi:unnamed protein product [Phaeothamnion confervicola]